MADKYPYMLTFINQINPRSYAAHTKKAGMDLVKIDLRQPLLGVGGFNE